MSKLVATEYTFEGVSKERRKAVVGRLDGATSRITAAAIQNEDELAFAIAWLTHHYVYKRSKGANAANTLAVKAALGALSEVSRNLTEKFLGVKAKSPIHVVSELDKGVISNPWNYL